MIFEVAVGTVFGIVVSAAFPSIPQAVRGIIYRKKQEINQRRKSDEPKTE